MHILIADDDVKIRILLSDFLDLLGHTHRNAADGKEALEIFSKETFDLVLLDLVMPHKNGLEVLKSAKELKQDTEIIIITGHGSTKSAVEALGHGAYAYIRKPIDLRDLKHNIDRIRELLDLRQAYNILSREKSLSYNFDSMIAQNPKMAEVKEKIRSILTQKEPILITGAPGAGKSYIANMIHYHESALESPMFLITPEEINSMIEFGSYQTSDGLKLTLKNLRYKLPSNNYGTIVVKRISELSAEHQKELVKGIFSKDQTNQPELRIIGLVQTIRQKGDFSTILIPTLAKKFKHHIHIPALRERREDIIPLAQMFLQKITSKNHARSMQFSRPVQEFFKIYNWPQNVSELHHLVNYVVSTNKSRLIKISDLRRIHRELQLEDTDELKSLENILTLAEKQTIQQIFKS